MRYVDSRWHKENREEIYRIYVTDMLGGICDSKTRYYDLTLPKETETRTGDEVIEHFKKKLSNMGNAA